VFLETKLLQKKESLSDDGNYSKCITDIFICIKDNIKMCAN
jgi:hypothetical protein